MLRLRPSFGLDLMQKGKDIESYVLESIYIPLELFEIIINSLQQFQNQFGLLRDIINKTDVGHFLSVVYFFF